MIDFITQNYKQTQKLAEIFAKEIAAAKPSAETAFIVALTGDLGSGKTTFTQGFVKGFGIKEKITSPTFVLMHRHRIKSKNEKGKNKKKIKFLNFENFFHLDCYRLDSPQELNTLGFKEIIANSQNIVLIEWADKIAKLLPKTALKIKFQWVGENKRK
ncbi:MAG: tRNA (adenosine(37)-N6)-threonylcarbamoyltransferase complex ATPase subunit type 1 TsaE, partial [Patescibacteria group bacterium]